MHDSNSFCVEFSYRTKIPSTQCAPVIAVQSTHLDGIEHRNALGEALPDLVHREQHGSARLRWPQIRRQRNEERTDAREEGEANRDLAGRQVEGGGEGGEGGWGDKQTGSTKRTLG